MARAEAGRGVFAWWALCVALAAAALWAGVGPGPGRDWQPALAHSEPWRWWTAAWVHYSPSHLWANVVGCAVLAAFGWAARLPAAAALAWALAWPLTHFALTIQPRILHYGGLSGVLHAGVAVACVLLLWTARRREQEAMTRAQERQRLIGAIVFAGLWLKVVMEAPWGEPVRRVQGWDIAVVPLAHAAGALAGTLCALALVGPLGLLARRGAASTSPPQS